MYTINKETINIITIKKSKFITTLIPVKNIEQVSKCLNKLKAKYHDANHNCYAYVLGINQEIKKSSDDKEPSKTAGEPILNALINNDITNVLAVVTRYFGGTLLGTGGLVRAYSNSILEVLKNSEISQLIYFKKIIISLNYKDYNILENEISKYNILKKRFQDSIDLTLEIPNNKFNDFKTYFKTISKNDGIIKVIDSYYGTKKKELN